jgi:hypothetical protein
MAKANADAKDKYSFFVSSFINKYKNRTAPTLNKIVTNLANNKLDPNMLNKNPKIIERVGNESECTPFGSPPKVKKSTKGIKNPYWKNPSSAKFLDSVK